MVALLRIVELCEGSIEIDGQDILPVGLSKLRENIAVIPQDPILFSGTVRTNLDPFDNHDDSALLAVLERVGLVASYQSTSSLGSVAQGCIRTVSDSVLEGGQNFSVGRKFHLL